MTEKEYQKIAAFYKDGPVEMNERWQKAEAAYREKFGYYSYGEPGFDLPCSAEGLERAVQTGRPCCNLAEEKEIKAYFKRQGKKLPQEYADAFNDPTPIIY